MSPSQLAKILGRRGGLARARKLSSQRRKEIASLGGQVKHITNKAIQRIERNFKYLKAVKILQRALKPKSVSRVYGPLPNN